ncbi:universal stress protein [Vagococcus acidifermentans]|uniref:Universal stress protein n=1 Tax=Vagococcus acidifermentans TaxID=564710 RepID=A0A430B2U6_9ENTE|nr:universal stress protein [Vagococcus acidifermentans]RSU14628.1 hypothetical protein CBF27_01190 [Vagococcus acidifermentans]
MLGKYQNILIAVDGSEPSYEAFEAAINIAKKEQAKLHVLYVNELTDAFLVDDERVDQLVRDRMDKMTQEIFDKCKEIAQKMAFDNVTYHTKSGSPKREIIRFNDSDEPIDLIIAGATGLSAVKRVMVGSTSAYVVNHAKTNVLIIK